MQNLLNQCDNFINEALTGNTFVYDNFYTLIRMGWLKQDNVLRESEKLAILKRAAALFYGGLQRDDLTDFYVGCINAGNKEQLTNPDLAGKLRLFDPQVRHTHHQNVIVISPHTGGDDDETENVVCDFCLYNKTCANNCGDVPRQSEYPQGSHFEERTMCTSCWDGFDDVFFLADNVDNIFDFKLEMYGMWGRGERGICLKMASISCIEHPATKITAEERLNVQCRRFKLEELTRYI